MIIMLFMLSPSLPLPLSISSLLTAASNADFYVSGVRFNHEVNQENSRYQKCMTLTAVDDILPEENEFFRISISSSDSLIDIEESTVRVYITDNGTKPLRNE